MPMSIPAVVAVLKPCGVLVEGEVGVGKIVGVDEDKEVVVVEVEVEVEDVVITAFSRLA